MLTCWGLPVALSVTLNAPFRGPAIVGLKVSAMVHFPPAPMIAGALVATARPLELEPEALGAALVLACETEAEADEAAPDMDEDTAVDSD